jgi:hypothetical protein
MLAISSDRAVARIANLVLEVAKIHPRKRRRLKFLAMRRKDLLDQLADAGLIEPTDDSAEHSAEHNDDLDWPYPDITIIGRPE